jgi:hypothetical protein
MSSHPVWPQQSRRIGFAGRDTLFHRENSEDLLPTNGQREAAVSAPSQPSAAAAGPGALPLGRDTLFHRENSGVLPSTNDQREAAAGVPSHPSLAAPGPGALPLGFRIYRGSG